MQEFATACSQVSRGGWLNGDNVGDYYYYVAEFADGGKGVCCSRGEHISAFINTLATSGHADESDVHIM